MMRKFSAAISVTSVVFFSLSASAHISLDSPTARQTNQLKNGPCGAGPNEARSQNVSTYAPGETIKIEWTEVINHPGHYIISFSENGTEDFVYPTDAEDKNRTELPVLLDGIEDRDDGMGAQYEAMVTLPMLECDNCTLQLIQVMTDKTWDQAFYHQCADIVIEGDIADVGGSGGADAMDGAGGSDLGSGGNASEGVGGAMAPSGMGGTQDSLATGGAGVGGALVAMGIGGAGVQTGGSTTTGVGGFIAGMGVGGTGAPQPGLAPADDGLEGGCSYGAVPATPSFFLLSLPLLFGLRRRYQ